MMIHERDLDTFVDPAAAAARFPVADEARLRRWVRALAVPRHRIANRGGNRAVREACATELERLGLEVELQGVFENVVALPRGAQCKPLTIVAAHYDTVPHCPGADDNASGLAVMLEVARMMAGTEAAAHVGFIAFNAEEDGMLGSFDFVASGLPMLRRPVGVVHVLEMVGMRRSWKERQDVPLPSIFVSESMRTPDFIGLLTKGAANGVADRAVASMAAPDLRVLAAKTWLGMERVFPDLRRSDHYPFWSAGLPAALWTDTGNFRNPNYHLASDTPETLDYAFMRDIATLLAALVAEM